MQRLMYMYSTVQYSTFIRRRQSSGFYRRHLGPVSDNVLKNRASKERALHQVLKCSNGAV